MSQEMKVTVDQKTKEITIVIPMEGPRPSKSGKTMVVASTHGNVMTDAKIKGQSLQVGVNIFYKKPA